MNLDLTKVYDISMPITQDMPVYKGKEEKRPSLTPQTTLKQVQHMRVFLK